MKPEEMKAKIEAQLGYIGTLDFRDPRDREPRRREMAYLRVLFEQCVQEMRRLSRDVDEELQIRAELACASMLYQMACIENAEAHLLQLTHTLEALKAE